MNRYEAHEYEKSMEKARAALAELDKFRLEPKRAEPVWKTRDGRTIPVSQMKDEHLMNALNYCVRNGYRTSKVGFLKIEARRRGLLS